MSSMDALVLFREQTLHFSVEHVALRCSAHSWLSSMNLFQSSIAVIKHAARCTMHHGLTV